jgi:hypothetical protein
MELAPRTLAYGTPLSWLALLLTPASVTASCTYHGVDAGAGDRPRTLLRDDPFPAARFEGRDRALD